MKLDEEMVKAFDKQFGMFFKDLPFEMDMRQTGLPLGQQGTTFYRGNMNQIRVPILMFIQDQITKAKTV